MTLTELHMIRDSARRVLASETYDCVLRRSKYCEECEECEYCQFRSASTPHVIIELVDYVETLMQSVN